MLLIPRGEGVETKLIKTSYSTTAGTAYITFDNVKVPVENLLGKEGKGLFVVLSNFKCVSPLSLLLSPSLFAHSLTDARLSPCSHERWAMCCGSVAGSRLIVEECMRWAHQRKVFGKALINQPVIRAKLAAMIYKVEGLQAYLENVSASQLFPPSLARPRALESSS